MSFVPGNIRRLDRSHRANAPQAKRKRKRKKTPVAQPPFSFYLATLLA
jgi:hypothetical protein